MSFIEHELKRCDKEETMENDRGKKRIHAELNKKIPEVIEIIFY